ncbi:MAG: hypothetical protein DMD98_20095 [Candidatus Rokuibacteriota bacterium]|nr:MAG: hypothetical protein DMD98_20095 [Candidatus Rokubacteria bacterium]
MVPVVPVVGAHRSGAEQRDGNENDEKQRKREQTRPPHRRTSSYEPPRGTHPRVSHSVWSRPIGGDARTAACYGAGGARVRGDEWARAQAGRSSAGGTVWTTA